jgi:hypothetical protein
MKPLLYRKVTEDQACLVHSHQHWEDVQAIRSRWLELFSRDVSTIY